MKWCLNPITYHIPDNLLELGALLVGRGKIIVVFLSSPSLEVGDIVQW